MVELLAFNGAPFKDHWAYFVRSHADDDMGVVLHATGDVMNGFRLEIKRSHDLAVDVNRPTSRIPLQWVDGKYFEEQKMLNYGLPKFDDMPFCDFEASAFKVRPPGPTLNRVNVNTVVSFDFTVSCCLSQIDHGRYESAEQKYLGCP
jgi:hypothetical protein